jgi:hypothetical protein
MFFAGCHFGVPLKSTFLKSKPHLAIEEIVMRALAASDGELAGVFPPFAHLSDPHIPTHDKHHKKRYSGKQPR